MDKNLITDELIKIIANTISGGDIPLDDQIIITPETYMGADLQLKSLDFIRLVNAIKKHFKRNIPFQTLFIAADGTMLKDIQIKYLADFIARHLW